MTAAIYYKILETLPEFKEWMRIIGILGSIGNSMIDEDKMTSM